MNKKNIQKLFLEERFHNQRITETTVSQSMIVGYVKQLFKRNDFPQEIFIALDDSTIVNKGTIIFGSQDLEHPYDFIPLPRIDELITNLPTKEEFLSMLSVDKMEDVTPEAEAAFWGKYEFQFSEHADGVKIIWE